MALRHLGTQPVETARLLLRRYTPNDAEAMYKNWTTDPQVTRWLRWLPHQNVEETRDVVAGWVADYAKPDTYLWAVTRKADGELIGSLGLFPAMEAGHGPDDFEPGHCYGRAFWGQGYATEALAAVMDYFAAGTGAETLYCCHAVENPASGAVLKKVGFVYSHDGVYTTFDGTEIPALYYQWQAKK